MRAVPAALALAAALLAAALLAAACGTNQPTATSSSPPSGSDAPASGGATLQPPTSFGPPPSPTPPDDTSPIQIDPALLDLLPESIDGAPVQEDLDIAGEALSDPRLPTIASAVDVAVAVDTGSGNLVTAWVVRLRPDRFGDEVYRQWRDSYDEGACTAAGGIVGNAEADIGGRNTYITSCVAALRTYHVWLEEQAVLISASSIGEGRFGEKLMEGLRVPE